MAECAYWRATSLGNLLAQSPGEESGSCTTLVVLTPAEYSALSNNPLNLSVTDGALVSAAVVSVWGIGWAWRQLSRTLNNDGDSQE